MNDASDWIIFRDVMRRDFTVGSSNVVRDVPSGIKAADFLYFFIYRDVLWPDAEPKTRPLIAAAMTEMYMSTFIHSTFGSFSSDDGHSMERAVLYGDLLSGTAAELLLNCRREDLLHDWLLLFQNIHGTLIFGALEEISRLEIYRKQILNAILQGIGGGHSSEAASTLQNGLALFDSSDVKDAAYYHIPAEIGELLHREQLIETDFAVMAGEKDQ